MPSAPAPRPLRLPFEIATPVDAYRLGLALEEVSAIANVPFVQQPSNDWQRGFRVGLNMALELIDLRIGVGS